MIFCCFGLNLHSKGSSFRYQDLHHQWKVFFLAFWIRSIASTWSDLDQTTIYSTKYYPSCSQEPFYLTFDSNFSFLNSINDSQSVNLRFANYSIDRFLSVQIDSATMIAWVQHHSSDNCESGITMCRIWVPALFAVFNRLTTISEC